MSYGWIYLRKNVNLKGEVMAYCIGKTGNEKKRRKTYRKENPFIEHVEDYEAFDMDTAETILKEFIEDYDMQLVGRSSEWLRKECFEEFYQQWLEVKGHYWVNRPKKPKPPKRKPLQPLGADAVKPLPPVGKPRPLSAAAIESIRASSALANKMMADKAQEERQAAIDHARHLATCNVPAKNPAPVKKQIPAFWQALGEVIAVTFLCSVGLAAFMLLLHYGSFLIPIALGLGFLWVLGTLSGTGKRRRRKAW